MKKLVFLLSSLAIVGVTASAKEIVATPVQVEEEIVPVVEKETVIIEPKVVNDNTSKLRVTSVNTGIWSENKSGFKDGNLGSNSLRLYTDFAYGDNWTGEIEMRRYFGSNTNAPYGKKSLFVKDNVRGRVGIMRNNIFNNYGLGLAYEFQGDRDKYETDFTFAPTKWFDGYVIYQYIADEIGSDAHYVEFQPKLSYKGWGVSYYLEGEFNNENYGQYLFHQMRLYTPTYEYAGFGISGEYRGTISYEAKNDPNINALYKNFKSKDPFGVNRFYANLSYKVNETVKLWTNVGYEFGKWEDTNLKNNNAQKTTGNLYQTIVEAGVKFKF